MNELKIIRHICDELGITQKRLSELSGVPYQSIRNYASASSAKKPSYENLRLLANTPELAAYRHLLLADDDLDDELISLLNELRAAGLEDAARAALLEIKGGEIGK